jgi:hypothetical protein
VPEGSIVDPLIQFLIFVGVFTLTFSLGEEIGMRGYLQPRLMSLGRTRALLLVGLLWATWHQVLIFLTPVDFPTGNLLLFFPLFYGTIVAASFLFGYLRIYTGSIWPASIAHSVHNAAWGPRSVAHNVLPYVGEPLPCGGLRTPDPHWYGDRGHMGGPHAQKRHEPSTRGRSGPRSAAPRSRGGSQVGTGEVGHPYLPKRDDV